MCGGSTLESTSKKTSSAPAPVAKAPVEKLNVAKVLGYGGADYYVKYRDGGIQTSRIKAVAFVKAGSTEWSKSRGDFYFSNMKGGFQTLKTLPNSLRKAS
jgi:hypothetical protein